MDKASIIKDAIDYIQLLQEQEKRMSAEISQLEMMNVNKERVALLPICDEDAQVLNFEKGKKTTQAKSSHLTKSPIEAIKVNTTSLLVYICVYFHRSLTYTWNLETQIYGAIHESSITTFH